MAQQTYAVKRGDAASGSWARSSGQSACERTDPAAHVFLNAAGNPWTVESLSAQHRRLRDAAGLDREIVLYLARHRFGTRLIEAGEDIKTVADLMGHASVKTTERYVHRDVRTLRGKQDLIA